MYGPSTISARNGWTIHTCGNVINHRLAFLSRGDIPPTGLAPHTDVLTAFPYLGNPQPPAS